MKLTKKQEKKLTAFILIGLVISLATGFVFYITSINFNILLLIVLSFVLSHGGVYGWLELSNKKYPYK